MKTIFTIIMALFMFHANSQSVIEMMSPGDANIILLETKDISKADIVVYKTRKNEDYKQWDYMWKFKTWGFANFSVYIAQSEKDTLLVDNEEGYNYVISGKIYFTQNKEERGLKNMKFHLEGVMDVKRKK